MANNKGVPLVFDTVDASAAYDTPCFIKSIHVSGNSGSPVTVLFYDMNQLAANRRFDDWSMGTDVAPDKWLLSGTSASVAQSSTYFSGDYSAQVTRAGTNAYLSQNILGVAPEPFNKIATWAESSHNNVVYGGMMAKTNAGSTAYVEIYDGVGTTSSSAHSGGNAWEWLATGEHTIAAAATELTIRAVVKTDVAVLFDVALFFQAKRTFYVLGGCGLGSEFFPYSPPKMVDGLFLATLTAGTVMVEI